MTESILAITGPTSGIGRATVKELVHDFDRILLLARNLKKAACLKKELLDVNPKVKIELIECDLSILTSVRQASHTITYKYNHIDCLINNAGIVKTSRRESMDGYELMMATNYIGPFLLTHELLPIIMNSERKQITVVSSGAYKFAPMKKPFFKPKHFNPISGYGRSKLGTLYLAQELYEFYSRKGLRVTAVHPGAVSTNIGKDNVSKQLADTIFNLLDPFFVSVEEGSQSVIKAVRQPEKYAGFYSDQGEIAAVKQYGSDFKMRREFIDATLKELDLQAL
ncbi:MAG: SDR family NAD(P)-dependent oxidoreductase [Alkalibacterium sp.]|uniref:Short-chain dehydrogenase n=1 Tax=Alkalibacterium gilvum TaxID=1130080 RepID=A0A1H6T4D0_9LACT|nr:MULTISPECIES: SDR family NAD(P)-dependent oxidoreductase [Alkalibacterium]MDN6194471.1 SDR family NAD(P)-dependent oxidoreductase [Alkalibacterium sp.]MDN6293349.1 SDR family NAD(P)-dependent oxidoreductase [Alkalibacterium sp.]MDN6295663.1 SDR family NAD(P)-dependent oxidoreductase [Alkalibacterium sp.]MDN6398283.1 SDR family NAD(P)-dependent oxidoreductase [Alkalibacterium sp.]MDN6729551.1 SDR family NAD(P)-dependent oxidoreductase [Alkalibacterium sp.]